VETHEAIEWLGKRMAWERWLTELHNSYAGAGADVENLAQRRQRRLPVLLTSDWWSRRSA
jgi:hypothetical protein